MNSTSTGGGFGRRIVPSESRDIALVPEILRPQGSLVNLSGRDDLKERVRSTLMSKIDPGVAGRIPRQRLRAEITLLVSAIATEEKVQLNEAEEHALAAELTDDMVGLGPLEPLLQDDEVTDILVNGPYDIYVERFGKLEKTTARFRDAQHVVNVGQRIASAVGRRIDEASPLVDARLADGSRVNIVLPPFVFERWHYLNPQILQAEHYPRNDGPSGQPVGRDGISSILRLGAGSIS